MRVASTRARWPPAGGTIPDRARASANALARSLASELAPPGIPVNAIAPKVIVSTADGPRALRR
jgi:NAD(P)-dependent dehydrogenase (short-subunit alcohol dehydrogenase family)